MCIIAFSPRGVDIPSRQQIKQMWQHNPDGAGYAYVNKKGKVVYRKGFLKMADLLKELEAPERFKNTNFAIHFRIGTSGKNDQATCHPFPVSNSFGDLRKTEGEVDSVLFHNGVLSGGGLASPLASDTQDFVIAMSPLLKKFNKSKTRDFFIEELVKGSRLLVLYKGNKFKMFGEWKQDGDIFVSNLNYKSTYDWYGSGYYGYTPCYDDPYFYDGYGDEVIDDGYRLTKPKATTYNHSPLQSPETDRLWREIIEKEYKFVSDAEFDLLKQSADSYTRDTLTLGDYTLGFNMSEALVWLEEAPELLEEGDEDEDE